MSEELNPANEPGKTAEERKRIPMTVPMQKLEVSSIPGYHMHWMRGTADRVAQAQRAGYEFVTEAEVSLNNPDLAGFVADSGNTDMGSRVSIVSGGDVGQDGQPVRLYLMKIKEEWWQEGQKILSDRSEKTAEAFRAGMVGASASGAGDTSHRYVKGKIPDLFNPNKRRPVSTG